MPLRIAQTLLGAVLYATFSCQGDCGGIDGVVSTGTTLPLHARYALTRYGGQRLPVTLTDVGTVRVRLLGDTLRFAGAAIASVGTYTETLVVGTTQGLDGERVTRTTFTRSWTRPQTDALTLDDFHGGGPPAPAPATLTESIAAARLVVSAADGRWYEFEAR
jgi:hypothetical protein